MDRKNKLLTFEAGIVFALIFALFSGLTIGSWNGNTQGNLPNQNYNVGGLAEDNGGNKDISDVEKPIEEQAKKIYTRNKKYLVLVNKEHEISDRFDKHLISICEGRLWASKYLYDDLKKMLEAGNREGYSFFIASAYRSKDKQEYLLDQDVKTYINQGMDYQTALSKAMEQTMPAGYSEHETGLALDILTSDNLNLDESQEKMVGNQWMRENCAQYGFILRYPKDKEEQTEISYEPWHFRYVGIEAAMFITEHNLSLEEFIEMANT